MDRNIHGCHEDPTDKIAEEIAKALEALEQQSSFKRARSSRISHTGIITGMGDGRRSYMNNLSMSSLRCEKNDDGTEDYVNEVSHGGTHHFGILTGMANLDRSYVTNLSIGNVLEDDEGSTERSPDSAKSF